MMTIEPAYATPETPLGTIAAMMVESASAMTEWQLDDLIAYLRDPAAGAADHPVP